MAFSSSSLTITSLDLNSSTNSLSSSKLSASPNLTAHAMAAFFISVFPVCLSILFSSMPGWFTFSSLSYKEIKKANIPTVIWIIKYHVFSHVTLIINYFKIRNASISFSL